MTRKPPIREPLTRKPPPRKPPNRKPPSARRRSPPGVVTETGTIVLKTTPETHALARELADERHWSLNTLLEELLKKAVQDRGRAELSRRRTAREAAGQALKRHRTGGAR